MMKLHIICFLLSVSRPYSLAFNPLGGLGFDMPPETIGLPTATEISLRPQVGYNLRER